MSATSLPSTTASQIKSCHAVAFPHLVVWRHRQATTQHALPCSSLPGLLSLAPIHHDRPTALELCKTISTGNNLLPPQGLQFSLLLLAPSFSSFLLGCPRSSCLRCPRLLLPAPLLSGLLALFGSLLLLCSALAGQGSLQEQHVARRIQFQSMIKPTFNLHP